MLFGTTKLVLYLDSNKVTVADCRTDKNSYWEIDYGAGELVKVLDKIIRKFASSSYKIILSSSVSYTVRWDKSNDDIPSRDQVRLDLGKEIPEEFVDSQFDWKIIDNAQIEAIVVTTPVFKDLQKIRTKYSQLKLETQSASSLQQEMGISEEKEGPTPELFRYAANKGLKRGNDAKVLNVEIKPELPSISPIPAPEVVAPTSSTPTISKSRSQLPIIITLILFIAGCGYVGYNYFASATHPAPPSPTPSSSPSPTPTPLPKQASDFIILVNNGTKKAGLAGEYQTDLQAAGFTQVEIGNSESPALTTTITTSQALPDFIQQKILDILSPRIPEISVVPTQSEHDIVITLGTK